ncbi:hypothetical protein L1987_29827 [Smallanthus sonchifolius]|uniref:Uncharacterized protein n=1 Tax=Smallanthus sonchifolius TaxID=185202 RepID=A0ACB9I0J9_9ASTR|nr:hypothetical protein L1987_29827 [Smallanthus sonchifolius]
MIPVIRLVNGFVRTNVFEQSHCLQDLCSSDWSVMMKYGYCPRQVVDVNKGGVLFGSASGAIGCHGGPFSFFFSFQFSYSLSSLISQLKLINLQGISRVRNVRAVIDFY